jgi:ABC-type nitrate/sulfonate/bicarbonate transport system substrate-binding protein
MVWLGIEKNAMKRLFFVSILLLVISPVAHAQTLRPVYVGDILSATVTSFYIAIERGFFKEQGLEIKLVRMAGDVMVRAVTSGNVAFGTAFSSGALGAASGLPVKIVVGTLQKPIFTLYARPESRVKRTRDLKGKKVGVTGFGTATDHAARTILHHHGLEPARDVALIPLKSIPNLLAGIQSGSVDAAILFPPYSFRAEKAGMVKLDYLGDILEMPNSGIFTSDDILKKDRDLLRKFLSATVKGIAFLLNDRQKDQNVALMMNYFKLDKDTAEASYNFIRSVHTPHGILSDASMKKFIEVGLMEEHKNKKVEDIFAFGPLKEILAMR